MVYNLLINFFINKLKLKNEQLESTRNRQITTLLKYIFVFILITFQNLQQNLFISIKNLSMETIQDYQPRASFIIRKAFQHDQKLSEKVQKFYQNLEIQNNPQNLNLLTSSQQQKTFSMDIEHVSHIGSLSNEAYKVDLKNGHTLIVKRYFQVLKQFVERNIQHELLKVMSQNKQYPYVFYCDNYCRVEAFIPGSSISREEINTKLLRNIAESLAKYSITYNDIIKLKKQSKNRQINNLFQTFRQIYKIKRNQNPQLVQKVQQYVLNLVQKKEIQQKLAKLLQNHQMILNHNDSNLSNILVLNSLESQNPKIQLLDFQFSNLNYIGYDIGNMLNQIATDYGGAYGIDQTGKQHNFQIRKDWQISEQVVEQIIQVYFDTIQKNGQKNIKIKKQDRKRYVMIGRLLSHLYWLFVGLKQIDDPNVDLNMCYYVRRRYQQFMRLYKQMVQ